MFYTAALKPSTGPGTFSPDDLFRRQVEAIRVSHIAAIVVAQRLLVEIAEQVERLDADVGSAPGRASTGSRSSPCR